MSSLSGTAKLMIVVFLQVFIVLALAGIHYSVFKEGREIYLHITPVDPRDPLRGDYVTFQYDISTIPAEYANGESKGGQTVYVPLRKNGQYWTVAGVITRTLPRDPSPDVLYLKGRVEGGGLLLSDTDMFGGAGGLRITYGIEEYFIPEGTGRTFNFFGKDAFAAVAVDSAGNAVLKQIYIDDKPWPTP